MEGFEYNANDNHKWHYVETIKYFSENRNERVGMITHNNQSFDFNDKSKKTLNSIMNTYLSLIMPTKEFQEKEDADEKIRIHNAMKIEYQ